MSWEQVMEKHAKSFHLASLFFPKHLIPQVQALYALCRGIDDAVDEALDPLSAERNLRALRSDLLSDQPQFPVTRLYRQSSLPVGYMEDLLLGAEDDLHFQFLQSQEDLIAYCYKVAGTVGLAMADLMGVEDRAARAHAVDLGIAMQITNICRDIQEDAQRGRVYIPLEYLHDEDLTAEDVLRGEVPAWLMSRLVRRLLHLADLYYWSARQAFPSIPFRARGAIIIAARLYRGIGQKLLRQGANPYKGRTYLSRSEKAHEVVQGLWEWGASAFAKTPSTQDVRHISYLHNGLEHWQERRGFSQ